MVQELSAELKNLVGETLEILGQAIRREYGDKVYEIVEKIRLKGKDAREKSPQDALEVHQATLEILRKLDAKTRFQVVHSFAASLEVINACENAFRSSRVRQRRTETLNGFEDRITYVLTAHPTESRSPESIAVFTQLTQLLIKLLEGESNELFRENVYHLLLLSLKTTMARDTKPAVTDEADYIFSIALRKEMISSLIENLLAKKTVFLRTWVGGDKDGHPGVNADVMQKCLERSREPLLAYARDLLILTQTDLKILGPKASRNLQKEVSLLLAALRACHKISNGDGKKISAIQKRLDQLRANYKKLINTNSPYLIRLCELFVLFPALVMPLELRENSALINDAKQSKTIAGMLLKMHQIARGGRTNWYTRGMVVSATETGQDIVNALGLVQKTCAADTIPVIPLFESKASLENCEKILRDAFAASKLVETCKREWASRFEVMLGYSDSAKENGSLLSRILICDALFDCEALLKGEGLVPIFFHGSGGSVARGGGSLEEQVSWWPLSARKVFKVTLQGEMIYRSFSMPDIFDSQVEKILSNSKSAHAQPMNPKSRQGVRNFALKVSEEYKQLIYTDEFLEVIKHSTPYSYLSELKIGSRPSKRQKNIGFSSLRAIPWVLCWTQIRSLLPIWWGIGTVWSKISETEKAELRTAFQKDSFFSSFIKLLAFSVAKVDLSVWFSYLQNLTLAPELAAKYQARFGQEYELTCDFLKDVTGEEEMLWFRPWLESSIKLRSTMIYPINMAQILALKTKDSHLLRESVTGIASGMLTTG